MRREQKAKYMSVREWMARSAILSFLLWITDAFYKKMAQSVTGSVITSYPDKVLSDSPEGNLSARLMGKLKIGEKVMRPLKLGCIKAFEGSVFLRFIKKTINGFLGHTLQAYGTFLLSFGLYTAIVFVLGQYALGREGMDIISLIIGIAMTVLAIPLLFSDRTLSQAICDSRILSFLLFGVIGVRREYIECDIEQNSKTNIAFIAGMILGLVTYFIPPLWFLAGFFGFLVMYGILVIPECGVLMIIFLIPFMAALPRPSILSAAIVLYVFLCYFLKLIRGKRTLKLEIMDGAVILFMALTLLGGVLSVTPSESMQPALVYACLMLSYFMVVNLIKTEEWVKRCICAFLISAVFVSLFGLYQNFLGTADTRWQDEEMFSGMGGRVISTFENPNVLAEYLIMALPFAIACLILARGAGKRFFMTAVCATIGGCLIYTWARGAWLGFMISMVLFFLIWNKKTMTVLLLGVFSIPILPFVLPDMIITRFTSIGNMADSSTAYRVHIWQASINMVKDFFIGGIGIGKSAFGAVYPSYTLAGIESAPHSHNLYLQILIETGFIGFLAFAAVMYLLFSSCVTFFARRDIQTAENKGARLLTSAALCAALAIMAQGMTDYVWYNYRIFLMFWIVCGLCAAIRRSVPKPLEIMETY